MQEQTLYLWQPLTSSVKTGKFCGLFYITTIT